MSAVRKAICVAFLAALFIVFQVVPTAAYLTNVTVDFSQQSFSCLVNLYGSSDTVDVTKNVGVTRFVENGKNFTRFETPVEYNAGYQKLFTFDLYGLKLQTDTDYKFTFPFYENFNTDASVFVQVYFKNLSDGTTQHFEIVNLKNQPVFNRDNVFTGTVHTPSIAGSYQVNLLVMLSSNGGGSVRAQQFNFGDCIFEIDSPLYGDHYEGDTSDIDDLNNQIESVEGQLPNMDDVDLDSLLDPSQLDAYFNGFEAVNASFGRIVDAFELAPIILFSLAIGLCNYLLGRRLSS